MTISLIPYRFTDFVEINPKVPLSKGGALSFVEMKDIDPSFKYVTSSQKRVLAGGSRFQNGDTLFARITPCLENGKIAQVKDLDDDIGFGSTEFIVFRGKKGVSDSDFVYYLSRTEKVRRFAEQHMVGTSGRQRVPNEAFQNLELELPSLSLQHRIAKILSSLDNKIELNRQMNQTLEEFAQTIFKHYFVDGIDPENLPIGWRNGKFGEQFNLTMGQSPPGDSYNETSEGMIFFQGRTDFGFRFPSIRMYTTQPMRTANKMDTLVSVRAPVGDINLANKSCCIGRGLAAIQHKSQLPSYTYYTLKNLKSEFDKYEGTGTVFGSINKDNFNDIAIKIPPKELILKFESVCNNLDKLVESNSIEVESLTDIRNYLLPKLISGEIIPSDIKQVEQAL